MPRTPTKPFTVDDLWRIERLGAPSLSPDGRAAVCPLTRYRMEDNAAASRLWLLPTDGGPPRALTAGDKDSQPRWSPRGDLIAFLGKRQHEGMKDDSAQLYVIAPDGGEARRVASMPTGVEAFRWFPDGRRIAFVSYVWPDLKGARAQARRAQEWKDRKETGYVTSQAQYRHWDHFIPQDRVAHLHVVDVETGKVRDLFEGIELELPRAEPNAETFDVSPDGRRIAFVHDAGGEKRADSDWQVSEVEVASRRVRTLVAEAGWRFNAPRFSPDGHTLALLARHQGRRHTLPDQLALCTRDGAWEVVSADWDHDVHAPLVWEDGAQAVYCIAEDRARAHVWRFDLPSRSAEVVVRGGTVSGFDRQGDTLVSVADAMDHPARAHVHREGEPARRLERFNDALLATFRFGRHEEVVFEGADGDDVQMWLVYPPNFDPKKRWPVMHSIHGGPHAASLDTFHYRWNNQLFAAQGYVVACVNYHGSSGFGHRFLDSITHEWGRRELQDIERGTDWILRQPWADPQRVFATGGSYGGYMVAWMNGHVAPGRYQAYVCHAGCFDWVGMFADDAYTWHAKELGGWYWDDMARVHAQSPHAVVAGMRTPTLVIHGQLDYRVPDAQGLAYYNTLKARGVDARLLWFPDENHWILKPRNSRLWYNEFFDWLRRHDPAARPPRRPAAKRLRKA